MGWKAQLLKLIEKQKKLEIIFLTIIVNNDIKYLEIIREMRVYESLFR
ncbi:MAG: hypothetical protein Q4A58_02145 [Fusobacterium sp.]|nr:hypothetical protein [Fusobacterium sp.]